MTSSEDLLGIPAVNLFVARTNKNEQVRIFTIEKMYIFDKNFMDPSEMQDSAKLAEKLLSSCKKFDRGGKGSLTADEYFNVIKMQHGIDVGKEEVKLEISYFMENIKLYISWKI